LTAPGVWLEDLTWHEAAVRLEAGAVVVVPIGARSKEHGRHLPMSTDYRVARALGDRLIAALPVVVAPVIDFGYYPAFVRYPGSQHLRAETFAALVQDVLDGFIDQGVGRIAIVNTGVSTVPPLRIVVRDLYARRKLRVPVADIERLGLGVRRRLSRQALGGHADQFETATMRVIAPDLVRMENAVADYGNARDQPDTVFYLPTEFSGDPEAGVDFSATGARGDPSQADAATGEMLLAEMAAELVAGLRALFPEAFP
jgi:creatinine amidohydrolase